MFKVFKNHLLINGAYVGMLALKNQKKVQRLGLVCNLLIKTKSSHLIQGAM